MALGFKNLHNQVFLQLQPIILATLSASQTPVVGEEWTINVMAVTTLLTSIAVCQTVVTEELPPTDPGVFTNHESRVCEPCHPQCVGGCFGGTVSTLFHAHYRLRM